MSETSDRIRKEWGQGDKERDKGLTTPSDIIRYDNIPYSDAVAENPEWNLLDLYVPKSSFPNGYPVIISIHGGGYVYGDKNIYQFYGMSVAQRGFAFVNFSYRLAPEYRFPTALEDTNKVVNWVLNNAAKYNLDTNNIFMVGDSAGGHYNALYSCLCTNSKYADMLKIHPPKGFVPNAIAINCGIVDPRYEIDADSERAAYTSDLMGSNFKKIDFTTIDTLKYINSSFPPTYIMTGSNDFLQKQSPLLSNTLNDNKVPNVLKKYGKDKEELFYHVFHVNVRHPHAALANDEETEFFRKYIK